MKDINLDEVVRLLQAEHGIANAYVEQTGGGCATIYAGPQHTDGNGDQRYAVAAGPGWFAGPGFTVARATPADFYIGPDDDGESEVIEVARLAADSQTDAGIARLIAEQVEAFCSRPPQPAYPDRDALLADAAALAGHLDGLAADQISMAYADGALPPDPEGRVWHPAPDGWVESDTEGRHFVASTGAAARYESGWWLPIDPGSDVLSDQGLALWGSENWGYQC